MSIQTSRCGEAAAAASASGAPGAGQKTPLPVTARSADGQHVVEPQVARPPSSRQSAVSSGGGPALAGVEPSRGRGAAGARRARVLQAGVREQRGDAVVQAGAVEGVDAEIAEHDQRAGGRSAAVPPASSRKPVPSR